MIKKIIFWLYSIGGPTIVVLATIGEYLGKGSTLVAYTMFVLVPSFTIPLSTVLLLYSKFKILKSKIMRVLLPVIIYTTGIIICFLLFGLFEYFLLTQVLLFLIFSFFITLLTYFELFIYKSLVIKKVNNARINEGSINQKVGFKSNVVLVFIKASRILATSVLMFIIPIFCFVTVITLNPEVRFQYDQYIYHESPSPEHLADLVVDVLYTTHFNERIEYIDLALHSEETLEILYSRIGTEKLDTILVTIEIYDKDQVHDLLLMQYIYSFLHLERYDDYKTAFLSKSKEFKDYIFKYSYTIETILMMEEDDPTIPVILDTLMSKYQTLEALDKEKLYNLVAQQYAYRKMGNSEKDQEIEQLIQEFIDQLGSKEKTN